MKSSLALMLFWLAITFVSAAPTLDRAEVVSVGESKAFISPAPVPAAGKPWVWYAPTFLGKYPNSSNEPMLQKLREAGIAAAGIDVGESYGSAEGTDRFSLFYREMVKRGYSRTPVLLAQSRGGLMLYNWAIANPTNITCIAGIYPVMDNRSYPGGPVADRLKDLNPIKRLSGLNVPVFHVHGDNDKIVPLEQNSGAMKAIYTNMTLKVLPNLGHQEVPEFFQDPDQLKFILDHVKRTHLERNESIEKPQMKTK